MTLVVVTKSLLLVDSKTVFGACYQETVRKIHFIDGHVVTSAGDPLLGNAAAKAGIESGFASSAMTSFGDDSDHTFVVVITPDNVVRTCYLGDRAPYWGMVDCETNENEIAVMTGSGRVFFLAYLAEHKDVFKAFGLVCDHHANVGWPITKLDRTTKEISTYFKEQANNVASEPTHR